jgi:hypothetical protein
MSKQEAATDLAYELQLCLLKPRSNRHVQSVTEVMLSELRILSGEIGIVIVYSKRGFKNDFD